MRDGRYRVSQNMRVGRYRVSQNMRDGRYRVSHNEMREIVGTGCLKT